MLGFVAWRLGVLRLIFVYGSRARCCAGLRFKHRGGVR